MSTTTATLPAGIDTPTWERTVYACARKLQEQHPTLVGDRFESAIVLVRDGAVRLDADDPNDIGYVASRSEPGKQWRINGTGCACPDATGQAPEGRCAHRIALGLYRRVLATLKHTGTPTTQTPIPEPGPNALATQLEEQLGPPALLQAACPEAAFSLCFRSTQPGVDAQLTIRAQTADDFLSNMRALFGDEKPVLALFQNTGQRPSSQLSGAPAPANTSPAPQPPPKIAGGLTFACKTLVGSLSDGNEYWKVKGGKFTKFGVTIWPEVLEAAGYTNLDARQTYDLTGWTATYINKDDGKADKVVSLRKG